MRNQIFLKNYSLEKNQDCAEICGIAEFMRNYAGNVKMCGKHQIMGKVAENYKLCDFAPTAPKRCP